MDPLRYRADKRQESFYKFFSLAFAIRPLPRPFLRLRLETNDHSTLFSLYYGLQHKCVSLSFALPSQVSRKRCAEK